MDSQGVGIGQSAALQKRRDHRSDGAACLLAGFTGSVADQAIVTLYPDQHGVPFQDGPLTTVIGEFERLRKRIGK